MRPGSDRSGGGVEPATAAAITLAYETLFDGALADPDLRLAHLEGGQELRADFLAQLEAAGDLAVQTRARVESIALESDKSAVVELSILLADQVVFDHIGGTAVRVEGRWLVGRSTFCDLAGQLLAHEPASCR